MASSTTPRTSVQEGFIYIRWTENGVECPIEKFTGKELLEKIVVAMGGVKGDLALLVSDTWAKAYAILGTLRLKMARRLKLIAEDRFDLLWVTEFPLVEYSEEEKRFVAVITHSHPPIRRTSVFWTQIPAELVRGRTTSC